MFNINEFQQNLNNFNEVAKSDKFSVFFTIPQAVQIPICRQFDLGTPELSLLCDTGQLPGRDINMIEYRHYGFIQRLPYFNTYGIAAFSFICTGDLMEKKLFDHWMDMMIPAQSGLVTYPQDDAGNHQYDTTIDVAHFDMRGKQTYAIQLQDAMLVSVQPLNMNWADDSVLRLQIAFAFKKWVSSQTDHSISSGAVNNYYNDHFKDRVNTPLNKIYTDLIRLDSRYNQISTLETRIPILGQIIK